MFLNLYSNLQTSSYWNTRMIAKMGSWLRVARGTQESGSHILVPSLLELQCRVNSLLHVEKIWGKSSFLFYFLSLFKVSCRTKPPPKPINIVRQHISPLPIYSGLLEHVHRTHTCTYPFAELSGPHLFTLGASPRLCSHINTRAAQVCAMHTIIWYGSG